MTKKQISRETRSAYGELRYRYSGNPLFIWKQIQHMVLEDEPLPVWTREYLKGVADRMLLHEFAGQDIGSVLKESLGIGDGKVFDRFHRVEVKNKVYFRVLEERENRPRGEKDSSQRNLYQDIGEEFGVSEHTVKKYFHEMKDVHEALDSLEGNQNPNEIAEVFKRIYSS